jgi:hypothetical protein
MLIAFHHHGVDIKLRSLMFDKNYDNVSYDTF